MMETKEIMKLLDSKFNNFESRINTILKEEIEEFKTDTNFFFETALSIEKKMFSTALDNQEKKYRKIINNEKRISEIQNIQKDKYKLEEELD